MPRFAANLSMMFTEVDFLDRFERAAEAGFDAVEFQFPYAFDAAEIRERLEAHRLELVLFNTPPGDWERGERGFACEPARRADFQSGIADALTYAKALGGKQVHCMAGCVPLDVDSALVRDTYIENLRFACDAFAAIDAMLLIEPINHLDIPRYFLHTTSQALSIIEDVGRDNLKVQYDIYHAQRTEGELAATLAQHLSQIGHVQIADNPGRHEPGSGEINFPFLFRWLDDIGYAGHVGCEYRPRSGTEAGLGWFASARGQTNSSTRSA